MSIEHINVNEQQCAVGYLATIKSKISNQQDEVGPKHFGQKILDRKGPKNQGRGKKLGSARLPETLLFLDLIF